MSLLTIVTSACDRIGLPRPSGVVSSTDQQVRQLLVFANQEGNELMKSVPWQELTKEYTFTTVAEYAQPSSMPSDIDRFVNDSIFNRTRMRKLWGPITAQEWQQRIAYPANSTVQWWFRIRGNQIMVHPLPPAGESVYYEYISNQWCQNAAGTTQRTAWGADDDTGIISEELMTLGIVWRFLKHKGLEWQTPYQQYTDQVAKRAVQQEGAPTLQAAGKAFNMWAANIKEGSWP